MVTLVILVTSCSTGSQVFGPDGDTGSPSGKTVPPVVWKVLSGLPPERTQSFKDAMALAAGQHDIGIVEGEFQSGAYSLSGSLSAVVEANAARVTYSFELRDEAGVPVDTIAGQEDAGPAAGGDAWASVTPAVLQRIAEVASQKMAQTLAQKGFATRRADLAAPPSYLFARAGPGAGNDIDLETLNGPGAVEPVASEIPPAETDVAMAEPIPTPMPEPKPAKPKAGSVEINAIAVIPVQGAKGPGNKELTAAMRKTLASVGWPVVTTSRANALVIRGLVDMSKPKGPNQQVAVLWAVETAQGKSLGDVKQANSVPAGSLDGSWGEAATIVAEAAAGGIFDIIQRYR